MNEWLMTQAVYLLRIIIAVLCGAAIGYERQNRLKTAGIRTHIIVSVAASLMMIISKYGFDDVIGKGGIDLDPSRIAAGVVTAIGFLGAGIIFVHNQTVSGLTTAAGIWATVGIGMAIGSGMYLLGVVTSVLIIVSQMLLHINKTILRSPMIEKIVFRIAQGEDKLPDYISKLESRRIDVINTSMLRKKNGTIEIILRVRFPENYNIEDVFHLLKEDESIQSIEI